MRERTARSVTFLLGLALGCLLNRTRPEPPSRPSHPQPLAPPLPSATAAALLDRVYPLHSVATGWEALRLERHKVVLVTGPQRSGTTWAACALASQLGFALYDERHPITGGNNTLAALRRAFAYARTQRRGAVLQSPMATSILHELPLFPGLAIVFLARDCIDVFRSQARAIYIYTPFGAPPH